MRDVEVIVKAASMAASAHLAQRRKGLPEPYINHPMRVAVAAEECGLSWEAIAAAYLHDTVEDTSLTIHDLHHCGFPERTIDLVRLLTKSWSNGRLQKQLAPTAFMDHLRRERLEYKPDYYRKIIADTDAVALKLLDRADNMLDMVRVASSKEGWARSYHRKTAEEFGSLVFANRNHGALLKYNDAYKRLDDALNALSGAGRPNPTEPPYQLTVDEDRIFLESDTEVVQPGPGCYTVEIDPAGQIRSARYLHPGRYGIPEPSRGTARS